VPSWKWKSFPSFLVEKPRRSSSSERNSPPSKSDYLSTPLISRDTKYGAIRARTQVHSSRRCFFSGLLLIIGGSAFAIWRNATAAQLQVAALHNTHLAAGNALATLRANVYLTGILTRDYLLDADLKQAPQ
jgi:hypothetical protein